MQRKISVQGYDESGHPELAAPLDVEKVYCVRFTSDRGTFDVSLDRITGALCVRLSGKETELKIQPRASNSIEITGA